MPINFKGHKKIKDFQKFCKKCGRAYETNFNGPTEEHKFKQNIKIVK